MTESKINHHSGDPRFFRCAGPFSLEEILSGTGARFIQAAQSGQDVFTGIAPLQSAVGSEISFLDNKRYLHLLAKTGAGLVLVAPAFADKVSGHAHALVTANPYLEWARIASLFYPRDTVKPGIHATACLDADVQIEDGVEVQPFAIIRSGVKIGRGSVIGSHVTIGQGVEIGRDCRIGSHVSLSHAIVGDRVTLYPGARIGQDGFGFAIGQDGFVTVPQIGKVILEDDVEVGANSTIDRGSVKDTIIGRGSRLDNLVQIGHNVQMGKCCIVVAQAGISGSTQLGDYVTIAAQAGLIGHIRVGDRARVGAQCGVMSDVESKSDVIGSPAMPFKEFFKNVAFLRRLVKSSGEKKG